MAKFCEKCGARLDKKTGLCPRCSREETIQRSDSKETLKSRSLPAAVLFLVVIMMITLIPKRLSDLLSVKNDSVETAPAKHTTSIETNSRKVEDIGTDILPSAIDNGDDNQEETENTDILPDEAKRALISFLEDYQSEYQWFIEDFYPNGDAVVLADFDGDGIDELLLNQYSGPIDSDNDGIEDSMPIEYCIYDWKNGEWSICRGPETIGALAAGYYGISGVVCKDGKAVLAVNESKEPYGTGSFPGHVYFDTVTLYDSTYRIMDIFEAISTEVGDTDNCEILM